MPNADLLTIHTDGAARGNPGPAAFAYVIERDGEPLIEEADRLGETTNNQAEYTALVEALEHALALGSHYRVVVYSDSELMVKQLNGEYRVKNEDLRPLWEEAMRLRKLFPNGVEFRHVRRGQNQRADELCNEALDGKRTRTSHAQEQSNPRNPKPEIRIDAGKSGLGSDLHSRALACLREAGVASPERVWLQLTELLREHLNVQLQAPKRT
jgi:ribonuclease HI